MTIVLTFVNPKSIECVFRDKKEVLDPTYKIYYFYSMKIGDSIFQSKLFETDAELSAALDNLITYCPQLRAINSMEMILNPYRIS